ncbi:hypothetical protein MJM95_28540, partial [Salmonella enterica subsp. enterica serovar Anatum]|nr:hypothetical protein [Salmonella enterica subsp. enterica serovar Anatum]
FSDDSIEARQREIAAKHGIRLTNHSLYLYGHCAEGDCREDEQNAYAAARSGQLGLVRIAPSMAVAPQQDNLKLWVCDSVENRGI